MSWLDRIFRRTEKRDAGFYSLSPSLGAIYSGATNEPESVPAAASCISLVSTLLASLPAEITLNGSPAPPTTPAARIVLRPSEHMSWSAFVSSYARDLLRFGNAIAWIQRDQRGAVSGLQFVPWSWLAPRIVDSGDGKRLAFDVLSKSMQAELLGLPVRLLSDAVMFCKLGASDDGVLGRSILDRCPAPVREGAEISRLALATWRNGMRPSAVLTSPTYLTPEQRKRKDEWANEYTGAMNAGRVPLLEGGWKLETATSSDGEFVSHRRFSTGQVAAQFGVPLPLIQVSETHSPPDLQPYMTALAMQALLPLATLIEQEFDYSVLGAGSGLHLTLDLSGMLRGSFQTQVSALSALMQAGALSANDVRIELGWERSDAPGADELRPNGAPPSWPKDASGLPSQAPKPGPTGDGNLPLPGTNANQGSGRGNGAATQ